MRNILQRINLPIAFAVALFFAVLLAHMILEKNDLTGNFLAEASGIAITVGLLGWLFRIEEKKKTRVARFAAYQGANTCLQKNCDLWFSMVKSTATRKFNIDEDIFTAEYAKQVRQYLDINKPSDEHKKNWPERIFAHRNENQLLIDKVLSRYIIYIAPELLQSLEKMEYLWINRSIISINGTNIFIAPEELLVKDFENLKALHGVLKSIESEIRHLSGFRPVYDITFRDTITKLQKHDIVSPPIGSARLAQANPITKGPPDFVPQAT